MFRLFTTVLAFLLASSNFGCSLRIQRREANDNGDGPLFLTPLIKEGKLKEARQAAEVDKETFFDLTSYSGFLTVNEEYKSNLFFWYFPTKMHPETAPLILNLEGGPGNSFFVGLLTDSGPIGLTEENEFTLKNSSWNDFYNVLHIDSPVGSGFSFTEDDAGYAKTLDDVARDLYAALKQIYKLFPEFKNLRFYITGESYASKFVHALASKIHKMQDEDIKMSGLIIGSSYADPVTQIAYAEQLYSVGLIDEDGLEMFKKYDAEWQTCIKNGDSECSVNVMKNVVSTNGRDAEGTLFGNLTGLKNMDNFVNPLQTDTEDKLLQELVNKPNIRKALHVKGTSFTFDYDESKVGDYLINEFAKSVAPLTEELLKHYRMCVYSGQLDILLPYRRTVKYLQSLQFPGAEQYKTAKRQTWRMGDDVAGYVKEGGNLVEILVRNAGHYIGYDQPTVVLEIVKKFIEGEKFGADA